MLSDSFSLAAQLSLRTAAFVVIMFDALCAAGAAFPGHQPFASSAEQLRCQQIFFRRFGFGGGFFVERHTPLHPVKQVIVNDCRDSFGDDHAPILVLSDVLPVFEDQTDPADFERLALFRFQPTSVQRSRDLADALAAVITSEYLRYQRGGQRIDGKHTVCAYHISQRRISAVVFAFKRVLFLSALYLLGQLSGVIFGVALQHGFKDDTLWPVGDILLDGYDLHAVLFQNPLVVGAVIAVTGKTVEFPYQHHIEQLLLAVLYHILKFWSVCGSGGQRSVDIAAENGDAVSFGILRTLAELAFDGFFSLTVRGIAGVDHSFHFVSTSESICTSVAFNRSFIAEPGSKHISTNRAISGLFRPSFTQLL